MCWEPSGSNQCHLLCAFDETRVQRTRSVPAQNNFMTSLPPKEPRPSSSQYSNPNAFDPLELLRLRLFNKVNIDMWMLIQKIVRKYGIKQFH